MKNNGIHGLIINNASINGDAFPHKEATAYATSKTAVIHIIMVLCGSVSMWIEDHIIQSTAFLGRLSLTLKLNELSLEECHEFLNEIGFVKQPYERLKILSITGGIPRYLEEIKPNKTADQNIIDLCFKKSGILFTEFGHIFTDIFGSKNTLYVDVLRALVGSSQESSEISKVIGKRLGGNFSIMMNHLLWPALYNEIILGRLKQEVDLN